MYINTCHVPATTADVERVWSMAGMINNIKRSNILPKNLEINMFLKANTEVIYFFFFLIIIKI